MNDCPLGGLACTNSKRRALRAVPDPAVGPVRILGVDEWARRKGQTYATILVDHEAHRIVDVRPDDAPETVAAWLQAHPTVEVVTRDRDEAFHKAIRAGAPQAREVADRFHLCQNLSAALERLFQRHPAPSRPPVAAPTASEPEPGDRRGSIILTSNKGFADWGACSATRSLPPPSSTVSCTTPMW